MAVAGWAETVPGAAVVRVEGSRTLVELPATTGDQVLLQAALATGSVREFRRDTPTLSELFRSVITEEPAA
jgi:ABC-2 type transport system ATP-binding protein